MTISDDYADRLAEIAAQLIARVRDDDPEANARWLSSHGLTVEDWRGLAVLLAAACPANESFRSLTAWARLRGVPESERPEAIIAARRAALAEACAPRINRKSASKEAA